MEIKRLFLQNVLAIGQEPIEILFPQTNGITLIKGLNLDVTSKSSNGAGKCLAASTRLLDPQNGRSATIEQWYNSGEDFHVLGLDEDLKLRPTRVVMVQKSGVKPLLRITLRNGSFVDVSETHPLISQSGQKLAKELEVGDLLQCPRRLPYSKRMSCPYSRNEVIILAALMAEGGLTADAYTFTNADRDLVDVVNSSLADFGLCLVQWSTSDIQYRVGSLPIDRESIYKRLVAEIDRLGICIDSELGGNVYAFRRGERLISYETLIRWYSDFGSDEILKIADALYPLMRLRRWFKQEGIHGHSSLTKPFPEHLLQLPDNLVNLFLCVYVACDGYVAAEGDGKRRGVSVASSSAKIADGLRLLFLRLGICGRIRSRDTNGNGPSYEFAVQGRDAMRIAAEMLSNMPCKRKALRARMIVSEIDSTVENDNCDLIPRQIFGTLVLDAFRDASIKLNNRGLQLFRSKKQLLNHDVTRAMARRYAKASGSDVLLCLAESDITWSEVIRVEPLGEGQTYDIQVDNTTHLYALDSVITHNSTIIEGILIALYGRTLRRDDGKPLTMQAMLHDEGEDIEARIELDYDDTRIVRTFTSKKSHVSYWVNGVPKSTDASATQVKKDLQDHINVNFETMCSILLFGQHHIFSFLEAGEADRREVFENLLNLKEYNLYEERAKELRKETKKKIEILTKSHETTVSHLTSQKSMLEQQKDKFRSHVDGLNRDIERIRREIAAIPDTESLKKAWKTYNDADANRRALKDQMDTLSKRISDLSSDLYQKGCEHQERIKESREPLDKDVTTIETRLATLETKREGYRQSILADRKAADAITDRVKIVDGDYQNRVNARTNSPVIFNLQSDLSELGSDGRLLSTKLSNIKSGVMIADEICPTCYGKIDPANTESVIKHHDAELVSLRNKYTSLAVQLKTEEQKRDSDIAIIKQEWTVAKNAIYTEQSDTRSKIDEHESTVNQQYSTKHATLQEQLTKAQQAVNDFIAASAKESAELLGGLSAQKQKATNEYNAIENQIRAIAIIPPTTPLSQVGALVAKKESLTKEMLEKTASLSNNPYSDIIDTLTKSVQEVQDKVNNESESIREQEKLLPYYDFWVGAMGNEGIKSFIIEGILPTLNEQIDYWMQLIYQGAISVKFDKYLNVEIKNIASKKGMKRYGQGSGGERRRIDIAIMLAFRSIMKMSTGKDPNIVFLDECQESVDEIGIFGFYNAVVDMAKTSRVYVITHNQYFLSLLENCDTILVEKSNGKMRIK